MTESQCNWEAVDKFLGMWPGHTGGLPVVRYMKWTLSIRRIFLVTEQGQGNSKKMRHGVGFPDHHILDWRVTGSTSQHTHPYTH